MSQRIPSIDLLRGLIMMFMALDHASFFVSKIHYAENWGVEMLPYDSNLWFITRFISHLCAPGFFLLMGMSMVLFQKSRIDAGWTSSRISTYFIKRGALLILIQFFLETPAWIGGFFGSDTSILVTHPTPGTGGLGPIYFGVLYALGASMMIGGILLRFKPIHLLFLFLALVTSTAFFISMKTDVYSSSGVLEMSMLTPGISGLFHSKYPLIPWLGITCFGMFLAHRLIKNPETVAKEFLLGGILFFILFVVIRSFIFLPNFESANYSGWVGFMTVIKYPPSIAFISITLGINLCLLYFFSKVNSSTLLTPLKIFGKTALFFYIVHLYLYLILGLYFRQGTSISLMYILWIVGLIILYFLCKKYLNFKSSKPLDSLWRFF